MQISKRFELLQENKEITDLASLEIASRVLKNIQTIQKTAIGEVKPDIETGNFKKVMSKLTSEIFKDE